MSVAPGVLVLGFILIFAAILYFAVTSSRKHQAEKNQQLLTLGFQAPESAPSQLQSRVEDLYLSQENAELALNDVYYRRELEQDLYIFTLYNTKREGTELGEEIFGMISSQLALPHFSLTTLPDFDRSSLMGGLMDKMLDKVMLMAQKHLGLGLVEFPQRPEYQDRFAVFGRDPSAVRDFLRDQRLAALEDETLPLQISGNGDFLTVDFSLSGTYGDEAQDLIAQYNKFREICRIFMN